MFDEETQTALAESDGDQQFSLFPENHRFQIPSRPTGAGCVKRPPMLAAPCRTPCAPSRPPTQTALWHLWRRPVDEQDRLSDAMLRDLVEHFSALELTIANLPEDELGQGYEYHQNSPTTPATPLQSSTRTAPLST